MRFCVIGGDRRLIYLSDLLKKASHTVYYAGVKEGIASPLLVKALALSDACILPVPLSRDGETLTGSTLTIRALLPLLPDGITVFGGRVPDVFYNGKRVVVDYLKDEPCTLRNALLTAEGVLRLIYERTETAFCDLSFLIYGYGRIATFLTNRLLALGSHVTVVARREEARAAARRAGASAISFREKTPVSSYVINTVPSPFSFPEMPQAKTLIDLAGLPPVAFANGRGAESVLAAPGLPGKYFPRSAAKILYETTLRKWGKP